jgi:hypothetical protein
LYAYLIFGEFRIQWSWTLLQLMIYVY